MLNLDAYGKAEQTGTLAELGQMRQRADEFDRRENLALLVTRWSGPGRTT
jgi:hypothetical protein